MLSAVLVLVGFGVLSGITTVLFGFGGGFVTVPVVAALAGATTPVAAGVVPSPMHTAVGTSTAVMIVTAASATVSQCRAGRLRRADLWPLAGWVAAGAGVGAVAALAVPEGLLRVLFAVYLAVTIVDTLARRGFLRPSAPRPLSRATSSAGGLGIGTVAALLGVGGSVMTVPLLRRHGRPMTAAVAAANPLSLPVGVVATAVYLTVPSSDGFAAVDLVAAAALLAGALPTIPLARRVLPNIPDRAHAGAYVTLLVAALLAVVLSG